MRKNFCGQGIVTLFLLILSALGAYAQNYRINDRTSLYTVETAGDSLLLKADSDFPVPVTLQLDLELQNLSVDSGSILFHVVPPHASGYTVARMKKLGGTDDFSCVFNWKIVLGDATKAPDASYAYSYPFAPNEYFPVSQGPEGSFSHSGTFAYDFPMPEGSTVRATRAGVVAFVDTRWSLGGQDSSLLDKANVISILHSDGTIGNYVHLQKDGALVKEGDHVVKGQGIAYSGNTGYSSGAHLHFEIVRPCLDCRTKSWISFEWEQPAYQLAGNAETSGADMGTSAGSVSATDDHE